jgi:hypothetical protein
MTSRNDPKWSEKVAPIIRARLEAGLLPRSDPARHWAGPGLDKPCDACDGLIARDDFEWEIDFGADRTLRFHAGCLAVWRNARHGGQTAV